MPGLFLAAALAAALAFFSRPPALVVTDIPFAELYGQRRIRAGQARASAALFRRVRPVMIADDASPDMLIAAIRAASERPAVVMFPRRFAAAAERFHREFPETPVALFRGNVPASQLPSGGGLFAVFGTDGATDLFRAGLMAGIAGSAARGGEGGAGSRGMTHVLWQGRFVGPRGRELFAAAAAEADPGSSAAFVSSAAHMPDMAAVSSMVLAGAGADFLERSRGAPVILFSWMDPALAPDAVVAIFDDSPWALAVQAARLSARGEFSAEIPSRALIFSGRAADNGVARALRRAARALPQEAN